MLGQPEEAFVREVAEREDSPLLRQLRSRGLVRKGALSGWIPADRYRDYLDSEMLPLVRELGLGERGDWIRDLATARRTEVEPRGARHGIPPEHAPSLARYARHLLFADDRPSTPLPDGSSVPPGFADPAMAGSAEELLAAFAQRHGIGLDEFRRYVLSDETPLADAANRLGIDEEQLRVARDAAVSVLILDAAAPPPPPTPLAASPAHAPEVVASITRDGSGLPRLAMDAEAEYAQTYYLEPGAIDALYELAGSAAEADDLLRWIRDVNRRKSVLHQLLAALLRRQAAYLASGDVTDLAPLTQADLARDTDEHPSTVSRLLRDRWIDIHGTPRPIELLLPSRTQVIAGLLAAMPESPDRVIAEELHRRFGLKLSRRSINYHRSKLERKGEPSP
jgi:hypothetical protein